MFSASDDHTPLLSLRLLQGEKTRLCFVFFYFNLIQNLVHVKSNSQFAPRQDQLSLCCCQPNSRLLITTVILPYCLFNKIFQILFKWKTKRIIPVQRSSKNMKERLSLDLEDYSLAAQKALVTKLLLCFFLQRSFSCHRLPQYSFTVYINMPGHCWITTIWLILRCSRKLSLICQQKSDAL